jgi:hypothetical protein
MKREFACLPNNYLEEKRKYRLLAWWVYHVEYPIEWVYTFQWWRILRFWLTQHTELGAILFWNEIDALFYRMGSRNGYHIFIAEEYTSADIHKRLKFARSYILHWFKSL